MSTNPPEADVNSSGDGGMPRQGSAAFFKPKRTKLTPTEEKAVFIMLTTADGDGKPLSVFSRYEKLLGFYDEVSMCFSWRGRGRIGEEGGVKKASPFLRGVKRGAERRSERSCNLCLGVYTSVFSMRDLLATCGQILESL